MVILQDNEFHLFTSTMRNLFSVHQMPISFYRFQIAVLEFQWYRTKWFPVYSLLSQGLAGIQAVDIPGIENVSSPFPIFVFVTRSCDSCLYCFIQY